MFLFHLLEKLGLITQVLCLLKMKVLVVVTIGKQSSADSFYRDKSKVYSKIVST